MTERPKTQEKKCSQCGQPFLCGKTEENGSCWCAAMPHLPPTPGVDCYCPTCLAAEIERRKTSQS